MASRMFARRNTDEVNSTGKTHAEVSKSKNKSCFREHMNYGGECLNCGWKRKDTPKKATTIVSKQTLEQAVQEANVLVEQLIDSDANDTRLDKLQEAINFLESILKKSPVDMQQEGASTLDDYLDDAVMPEMAQKIKQDVDMIAKMKNAGDEPQPDRMGNLPSDSTVNMNTRANEWDKQTLKDRPAPTMASGSDSWDNDRDEQGEPKVPELAEIPRLAKLKALDSSFGSEDSDGWRSHTPCKGKGCKECADNGGKWGNRSKKDSPKSKNADLFYGSTKKAGPVVQMPAKAPAPAAKPSATPSADITQLSSDTLAKMQKALAGSEDLMNDKAAQAFIAAIAEELMNRPVEVEQEQAPAQPAPAAMPLAASVIGGLIIAADEEGNTKVATSQGGAWFVTDKDSFSIKEDGGRTPEIGQAHSQLEDHTGIKRPATELPSKFASFQSWFNSHDDGSFHDASTPEKLEEAFNAGFAEGSGKTSLPEDVDAPEPENYPVTHNGSKIAAGDMTTGKALKTVERLGNSLKSLYFEAKPVTEVLGSRPVREAVEAIYRAYDLMGEAGKVLNKQNMQEEAEEQALEIKDKNKKKSSSALFGLALAAEGEDKDEICNECGYSWGRCKCEYCPKCHSPVSACECDLEKK